MWVQPHLWTQAYSTSATSCLFPPLPLPLSNRKHAWAPYSFTSQREKSCRFAEVWSVQGCDWNCLPIGYSYCCLLLVLLLTAGGEERINKTFSASLSSRYTKKRGRQPLLTLTPVKNWLGTYPCFVGVKDRPTAIPRKQVTINAQVVKVILHLMKYLKGYMKPKASSAGNTPYPK